jgi:multidrug efflux system membrane fusion protein
VKAGGNKRRPPLGALLPLALVGAAAFFAYEVNRSDRLHPSSDDASIDADILHVAPSVGGQVVDLPIKENQLVAEGDLLFRALPQDLWARKDDERAVDLWSQASDLP